jgi:uncharacterized damage-inducible protein DinB
MDSRDELVAFSDGIASRTRERLADMGDDEYLWEPAPACWTVGARPGGEVGADWAFAPEGTPFTTIAWRLWHLTVCYGGERNERLLRGAPGENDVERTAARATAAEALDALAEAQAWWRALLASLSDEELGREMGPIAEQYAEHSRRAFVLHMLDEHIHHAAEVALLRDLYRANGGPEDAAPRTPLEQALSGRRPTDDDLDALRAERPDLALWAAANGYWRAVPLLVEAGFAVDVQQHHTTALHHAAAAGEAAIVRLLLDRGADPTVEDDVFHAPPAGWAAYFGRRRVVALLDG